MLLYTTSENELMRKLSWIFVKIKFHLNDNIEQTGWNAHDYHTCYN
jgi:hypothetical protein